MPEIGQTFSHYRILEKIGGGGMGVVYRAEDTKLGRHVALKFLSEEICLKKDAMERFQREARSASALNHPNICTIYEINEYEGQQFIAMEYLEGQNLKQLILERKLQLQEILDISVQVTDGLDVAHSRGIIHRDIKPGNIFITRQGLVKLLDFGLAKLLPEGLTDSNSPTSITTDQLNTMPGTAMGTVGYMSPEQTLGENLDSRSDIFSLGAVIYEMAARREAFTGNTVAGIYDSVLHGNPEPLAKLNPGLPMELQNIISRSLDKKPDRRYQSASDLRTDLRQLKISTDSQYIVRNSGGTLLKRTENLLSGKWRLTVALAILLASLVFLGIRIYRTIAPGGKLQSIAVMPFESRVGDSEMQYNCESLTRNIIDCLSLLPELDRIPSWLAVEKYIGADLDYDRIKQELEVDYILTGEIVPNEDDLIIEAQLTDIRNMSHIWQQVYPLTSDNLIEYSQKIADELTQNLHLRLIGADRNKVEIENLYLRGQYYWNKRTAEDLEKAIDYFNRITDMDPDHARAHAALATCYSLLSIYSSASPEESFTKAKEEATLALKLDEGLAEAHTALALVYMHYEHQWDNAEAEYKQAILLDPEYGTAHQWYAELLTAEGRFEEAENWMLQARKFDSTSLIISATQGWGLYSAGRYEDAIRQLLETLDRDPDYAAAHWFLGCTYAQLGRYGEAIASLQRASELQKDNLRVRADLGHVYALSGKPDEAIRMLEELRRLEKEGHYVSQYSYAVIYSALGELDQAFKGLWEAVEDRPWEMVNLKVDPMLKQLRSDPRFDQLMRHLDIP